MALASATACADRDMPWGDCAVQCGEVVVKGVDMTMVKTVLGRLDKLIHWRRFLIRHKLFDILDYTLLANTNTDHRLPSRIKEEWRVNTSYRELVNIHRMLKQTEHLKGDIAELGVYRGGTAKLMALTCPHKALHLFDTFSGIPCKDATLDDMDIGECKAGISEVQWYLKGIDNAVYHPGLFPKTAKGVNCKFSFVNMDADQYASTLDGLAYFYPRMVTGGIIILHDYFSMNARGVAQAVVEYKKQQELACIPLWDTQLAIIKCGEEIIKELI